MFLPYSAFPRIAARMIDRALERGARTIFFPESGALPLRECVQHLIACDYGGGEAKKLRIYSSKLTAYSKIPLSNQLLGLMSVSEQKSTLKSIERTAWQNQLKSAPKDIQKKIFITPRLAKGELSKKELVLATADLGITLRQGWQPSSEDSLFECKNNKLTIKRAPITNVKDFEKRKRDSAASALQNIITPHEARPLLQIILSQTTFGKALQKSTVYVCEDAISRGRALLTLDIIFRSFTDNPKWYIGVCSSPIPVQEGTALDFVAGTRLSPFMNRPDLIGQHIVSSTNGCVVYTPKMLFGSHQLTKQEQDELLRYDNASRNFFTGANASLLQTPKIFGIEPARRLLHFCFVGGDALSLSHYLNMNPVDDPYISEACLFYLSLPHPLCPIAQRECFQESCINLFNTLQSKLKREPAFRKDWEKLRQRYHAIRQLFLARESIHWAKHKKVIKSIWQQSFNDIG